MIRLTKPLRVTRIRNLIRKCVWLHRASIWPAVLRIEQEIEEKGEKREERREERREETVLLAHMVTVAWHRDCELNWVFGGLLLFQVCRAGRRPNAIRKAHITSVRDGDSQAACNAS